MESFYETVQIPDAPGSSYGCGWFNRTTVGGIQTWYHGGFWGGWTYYIQSLDLVFSGAVNQHEGSQQVLIDQVVAAVAESGSCRPRLLLYVDLTGCCGIETGEKYR